MEGQSTRTVVIAFLSNVAIAVAKLIGGLLSGSTGLLAEAAHSAADTVNEVCLAIGLYRSRRLADISVVASDRAVSDEAPRYPTIAPL